MVLGPGLIIFPGSPLQHRRLQAATSQGPIVFARLCENSRNVLRLGSARTVQDCDFEYLSVRPERRRRAPKDVFTQSVAPEGLPLHRYMTFNCGIRAK
jgi:hypothetical protein